MELGICLYRVVGRPAPATRWLGIHLGIRPQLVSRPSLGER